MSSQQIHLDGYLGQAFDNIPVATIVVNARGEIVRMKRLAMAPSAAQRPSWKAARWRC